MVVPEPAEGQPSQGSAVALVRQCSPLWRQQQWEELGLPEAQEVGAGLEAGA